MHIGNYVRAARLSPRLRFQRKRFRTPSTPAGRRFHAGHATGEAALLSRLHASEESALAELFTQHYTHLCSYAYKLLGSPDLAESAVLDVMTSLWNRRETLRIYGTFRGYLAGAVRLRALHIARSQRLTESWTERTATMTEPSIIDDTLPDPETTAIHNDLNRMDISR